MRITLSVLCARGLSGSPDQHWLAQTYRKKGDPCKISGLAVPAAQYVSPSARGALAWTVAR